MKKELNLKIRVNKRNGGIDVNLPKKNFTQEELDKIQKKKAITVLWED